MRNRSTIRVTLMAMVLLLLISGCGGDDVGPAIPFSGGWGLGFYGAYEGGASISISHDGNCSDTLELTDGHNLAQYSISFNVDGQGEITYGKISNTETEVGQISGQFSGSSGSGSYQIHQVSGTWSAWRNQP